MISSLIKFVLHICCHFSQHKRTHILTQTHYIKQRTPKNHPMPFSTTIHHPTIYSLVDPSLLSHRLRCHHIYTHAYTHTKTHFQPSWNLIYRAPSQRWRLKPLFPVSVNDGVFAINQTTTIERTGNCVLFYSICCAICGYVFESVCIWSFLQNVQRISIVRWEQVVYVVSAAKFNDRRFS